MTKFCGPLFVFLVSVVAVPYAHAQLYWDVNGTNPGSSDSGDASGTWSSTSATWNTAADGSSAAPAAWVPDSVGVFSAGSSSDGYTVTLTDAESASGITFQDGPNGLTL